MAVKSIQLGQVWRKDENGQDYLVTKVYSEVFTQYAVLRPAEVNAPDAPLVEVRCRLALEPAAVSDKLFERNRLPDIHILLAREMFEREPALGVCDLRRAHRRVGASLLGTLRSVRRTAGAHSRTRS